MKKAATPEVIQPVLNEKEALAKVKLIEQSVALVVKTIGKEPMRVEDDDDFRVASTELIKVVLQREAVDEQLALFMIDVKRMLDRVNGWFAKPKSDLAEAEAYFRDAIREYALALDTQAHELRLAAGKTKDSEKADEMLAQANALLPPKVPGIAITTKVKVEVLDEKKIPERFFKRVVDMKALEAAADAGEKVAGVKFNVDKSVRVTPKHAKLGEA